MVANKSKRNAIFLIGLVVLLIFSFREEEEDCVSKEGVKMCYSFFDTSIKRDLIIDPAKPIPNQLITVYMKLHLKPTASYQQSYLELQQIRPDGTYYALESVDTYPKLVERCTSPMNGCGQILKVEIIVPESGSYRLFHRTYGEDWEIVGEDIFVFSTEGCPGDTNTGWQYHTTISNGKVYVNTWYDYPDSGDCIPSTTTRYKTVCNSGYHITGSSHTKTEDITTSPDLTCSKIPSNGGGGNGGGSGGGGSGGIPSNIIFLAVGFMVFLVVIQMMGRKK